MKMWGAWKANQSLKRLIFNPSRRPALYARDVEIRDKMSYVPATNYYVTVTTRLYTLAITGAKQNTPRPAY